MKLTQKIRMHANITKAIIHEGTQKESTNKSTYTGIAVQAANLTNSLQLRRKSAVRVE